MSDGHPFQRARKTKMDLVKDEIIRLGGWIRIKDDLGQKHFAYHIADLLNCTYRKAQEYIDLSIRSSVARARIEEFLRAQENEG